MQKFKELAVGNTFRFQSEVTMPHSGMKTGVCVKTSPRKYQYVEDGTVCEVGTVNVEVNKTA